MDNTTFAYLFGAFILGFLVAWLAGRSGPKHELEDCRASGQELQRKLDDRGKAVAKAEDQVARLQADLTGLSAEKGKADAALQAVTAQLADAVAEAAAANALAQSQGGEILRLQAELRHASDAWAGSRERSVELANQLETAAGMAAAAEQAAVVAEAAIAEAEADELASLARINELTTKLDVMMRELDLTRAAAARTAALTMLRPQLTPERRAEYAALAGDPERVVSAMHERDIAVADAVNENSYLRRSLGIMTGMGSDLAAALDKRNREYDAVSARLAAAALVPTMIATRLEEETPAAEDQGAVETDAAAAEAAADNQVAAELQAQFEDLWARLNAATAANSELEGQLQAQNAGKAALLARLGAISGELEALRSDPDADDEDATATADAPATDESVAATEDDVLKRLAAGVALAVGAIQRKNARVGNLVTERAVLENGLAEKGRIMADLNAQVNTLQTDANERGVKLDALSLRASSLEAELAVAQGDRTQFEEQVRQIAEELAALADQFAPPAPAPSETADAAAESADADAPVAAASDEASAAAEPAEEASAADAAADAPADAAAADAPVAAESSADAPALDGAVATIALLTTSAARLRSLLTEQQLQLTDAGERLHTLDDQFDAVNEEESALSATLADKEAALADAGQQLDTLQASLAAAAAEYDGLQQRVASYHAQLSDLLTQYTEPEAPAADEPVAAEAVAEPAADAAATEAGAPQAADAVAAAADDAGAAAESDAADDAAETVEPAPAVDPVAATIAAVAALFARKQAALTALDDAKRLLDANLAAKDQSLADVNAAYAGLEDEFGKRSVQFDALSLHAGSLESDMEITRLEREQLESRLQAVADQLGAIAASYAPAPSAAAAAVDEAPAGEPSADAAPADAAPVAEAPAAKPLAAQLEDNAAAVIALVEGKAAALSAAQAQIDALQQDLATRSGDLDAASTQASDLAAQLAAAEAAKAELASSLSAIGEQVAALSAEAAADEPPAEAAPAEAEAAAPDAATPVAAEPTGAAATLAGIAGLGVVLARRRQALAEGKARIAELEQQVTDLTAQLQASELDRDQIKQNLDASGAQIEALTQQVADLQAQLDAATAERDGLRGQLDEIGSNLEALGAAADADDDAEEDRAMDNLVKAGLVAGGATALVSSRRNKRSALDEANAQVEQLQQQLAAATAAQADLEARAATQLADYEAASNQVQELQAKLEAAAAEQVSVQEAMQRQLEETQTQMQEQDSQLVGLRRQLDLEVEWQRKSPFLAGLIQKLNKWSGTKAAAASAALEEQVVPKTVRLPENLTDVTHIGKTYADRLHDADVGTHWELAFVPDEDLAQILKLNELQLMGMNFNDVRASARQLAVESGSVGHMWERGEYDDFEPIKGIGKVMEKRLYAAGITTYAQLVAMTPEQLDEVCKPKPPLRPKYDSWIAQAQELLAARAAQAAAASAAAVADAAAPEPVVAEAAAPAASEAPAPADDTAPPAA